MLSSRNVTGEPVDLYDFFEALIHRTPWSTEAERDQWLALIAKHRATNLFGYMATVVTTEKLRDERNQDPRR